MDNKDLEKEDTMYFGEENPEEYENSQNVYSEEDMYEEAKPLVTINSVEYDEGDYACEYNGEDIDDVEKSNKRHNNIIWAYIIAIVIIVIIIGVAITKI